MNPLTDPPYAKLARAVLKRGDLPASAKLAIAIIADDMRERGRADIGIRWLASQIGIHPNSAPRVIRAIEESGLLVVERQGNGRRTRFILPPESATETGALSGPQSANETVALSEKSATQTGALPESKSATVLGAERQRNSGASATVLGAQSEQTVNQTLRGHAPTSRKRTKPKTLKTGGDHQAVIRHFTDGWSRRHDGAKYAFAAGRDGKAAKTLLDAVGGDKARACSVVDCFLDDDEPYIAERAHPFALIHTRLNTYAAKAARLAVTSAVEEHPIVRDAIARFGAEAVEPRRRELNEIASRVEDGSLPSRRVGAAMRKAADVAAFIGTYPTQEVARAS